MEGMSETDTAQARRDDSSHGFFGQPRALANIFGVEMWERFSFYGMQGILLIYLYYSVERGGLGIDQATTAMQAFAPGARIAAFGHVGDGNIHFDVLVAEGGDGAAHSARRDEGSRIVHDIAVSLGGSISAEHGLGAMKTAEGARFKSETELAALRAIRQALDPKRIMNPRVLF